MLVLFIEKKRELLIFLRMLANAIGALGLVAVLASCGTSPGYNYTVGGTVSGMVGSGMVLQNNGGDDLKISANGSFSFATALTDATAYSITVKTQPINPSQSCSVSNGSGTVSGAPVNNVVVNCVTGPTSVAVDPSGQFAYATNQDGTISPYTIQPDGTLNPGTPVAAGTYPISVAIDPLKRGFAYAVDAIGGTIWAYKINSGGSLTALGMPMAAGAYPSSVTVDPSGQFVYVTNMGDNTISAYTIQLDGTLVELANSPFHEAGTSPASIITVKLPVGEFAYVTNMNDSTIWFYTISSDGNLAFLGELPTGTYPSSVTVDHSGVDHSGQFVYVANESSNFISVYIINQTNGTLIAGTSVTAGMSPTSVVTALVGSAEFAYATNTSDGTVSAYAIDSSSGALNPICGGSTGITCPSAGIYPTSITVDNPLDGKFAYVANMGGGGGSISVLQINPDGTLILISP